MKQPPSGQSTRDNQKQFSAKSTLITIGFCAGLTLLVAVSYGLNAKQSAQDSQIKNLIDTATRDYTSISGSGIDPTKTAAEKLKLGHELARDNT